MIFIVPVDTVRLQTAELTVGCNEHAVRACMHACQCSYNRCIGLKLPQLCYIVLLEFHVVLSSVLCFVSFHTYLFVWI